MKKLFLHFLCKNLSKFGCKKDMHHDLKMDIFRITLKGLLLPKDKNFQKACSKLCFFQQVFYHVDHLEF